MPLNPSTIDLPASLPQVIARGARLYGDTPAIVEDGCVISYAQLEAQSRAVAASLIALGVAAGERVAIWAPNRADWIIAACGVHAAGAVLVPINTRMKGFEAAEVLERSGAKLLFCIGDFLKQYYPAQLDGRRPASLQHLVVLGSAPAAGSGDLSWDEFIARGVATPAAEVDARIAAIGPNTIADLMFTSGTTGRSKGVLAAHGPTIRAFSEWSKVVGLDAGDRYLIINPFFHTFGYKAGWVAAFLRGATVYPHQVFDADTVLARIAQEKISFLPGPPTLFLSMLAHPRLADFDLASLKASCTGAATVPPVLIERMRRVLGIRMVTTAYGLTECGGCATLCDPSDSAETIATTCGRALPGTEAAIMDAEGRILPAGETGEVVLRGYHVMRGYFDDPAATAEAIDAEGWLHTGDVGVMDERGYLRITDRLKDMFIVGGFNCYPAEIERLFMQHPGIAQVAVIGVPEERMGEVGCAYVVLRPDAVPIDEAEMIAWSRVNMANYKVPRYVRFVEALPVNASNKVDKKVLRGQWG